MKNMKPKSVDSFAYVVPATDLYRLKIALSGLISEYQHKMKPENTKMLKELILLEHDTNLDKYETLYLN